MLSSGDKVVAKVKVHQSANGSDWVGAHRDRNPLCWPLTGHSNGVRKTLHRQGFRLFVGGTSFPSTRGGEDRVF